jgi:predicted thioesterase
MIAMMERTAARLAAGHLADGRPTCFEVCIKHVAGAGEARVHGDGAAARDRRWRKLRFEVEVREGDRVLGLWHPRAPALGEPASRHAPCPPSGTPERPAGPVPVP